MCIRDRDKIMDKSLKSIQIWQENSSNKENYQSKSNYTRIEDEWEYQDYTSCFVPIPKDKPNYYYHIKNKNQTKGIESNDKVYNPVIAFRGVYDTCLFFFYGTSLFAVSNDGRIAEGQLVVFPYSYVPCYLYNKLRYPANCREKILVHRMQKYFSKKCIYQKEPACFHNYQNYGLEAFGIRSAQLYTFVFIPMGDIIKNDYINPRVQLEYKFNEELGCYVKRQKNK